MDGSQKLPQRLLGTIRDRLAAGKSVRRAALGVAGWMRYVTGHDEAGRPIDVRDPLAPRLRSIADDAAGNPERLVEGLLSIPEVFGADLPQAAAFSAELVDGVSRLYRLGARETVRLS
jgi:fructuronate reductase